MFVCYRKTTILAKFYTNKFKSNISKYFIVIIPKHVYICISNYIADLEIKEVPQEITTMNEAVEETYIEESEIPQSADIPANRNVTIDEPTLSDAKSDKPEKTKKKRVIKKVQKVDQDDYIQKLMEAEIPKTKLEKYEKFEMESDIKPKEIDKPISVPAPVIIKIEKKPVQPIEHVVEEFEPIKLKPRKTSMAEKEEIVEPTISRKLKSRITQVEYPPNVQKAVITDINATRQSGELTRTIEEIENIPKTKTKKFKPLQKPSTELEKPDLEVYEKYESEPDEPAERVKYNRATTKPNEDTIEQKSFKLGKGKSKTPLEEKPEVVVLKKIPDKHIELDVESVIIPKIGESSGEISAPEKIESTIRMDKFIPTDIKPFEDSLKPDEHPEKDTSFDSAPEIKPKKITRKTKVKDEPETIPAQLVPGVPQPKDKSPEKDVSFKYQQKPKADEPVETVQLKPFIRPIEKPDEEQQDSTPESISLPEPAAEHMKTRKKKTKKETDKSTNITLQLKSQETSPTSIVDVVDEHVDFVIKPTKSVSETHEVSTDISLPKLVRPTEYSADASLTIEKTEEIKPEMIATEEIKLKKRKQKVPVEPEPIDEFVVPIKPANVEDISQEIKLSRTTPRTDDSEEAVLTIEQPELEKPQETKLKMKKKKIPKIKDEVDTVVLKTPIANESIDIDFTVSQPTSDTIADDVQQEFTIKKTETVESEPASENITVKKVKKIRKPITVSVEETVELESVQSDDVAEVNVELSRPKSSTAYAKEDIEIETTITQKRDQEEPVDMTQEFTIKKKTAKKPTPVIEEHDDEFTIKKLKKKPRVIEIPGYTDTENVTFRPRSTKTKEDVEQEFKIQLDSYAEEEVSMSGKIKLKKLRPKTYSEEAGETHIRITEEYDDAEGPIIEEIVEDSEPEDTMYDVEEPDEYSDIDELPKEVEFKLKTKNTTPEYKVEEFDEEDVSIHTVKRKKKQQVTYDVDSLTLKKQPKRKPSTYLEGYYLYLPAIIIICL